MLSGCARSMDDIIASETSTTGIVSEICDEYIVICIEEKEYRISTDIKNRDSYTSFVIGDKITVYYNGEMFFRKDEQGNTITEINKVYATVLVEPADREINEKP